MAQSDMPTMRSKRLGGELKRLRQAAGINTKEAAEKLMCGQPKISQIENGRRGIRQLDLALLLDYYGVEDQAIKDNLARLAKSIHQVDWWQGQGPLLHDELRDFLTLESDSSVARVFENMLVPGLLQTEGYMREIFTANIEDERVEVLTATRLRRAELLKRRTEFRYRTIIDEAALHRIPDEPGLAADQLRHLLAMSRLPNVTIQVLSTRARVPLEQIAPYHVLTLTGQPAMDVVWLEHMAGGALLEQEADVALFTRMWDELSAAAMPPVESRSYIGDLIGRVENGDGRSAPAR
ncbi:helix-turn-helix domain-containing protein [Streptomyces xiaopingdaonensis]|uniref:helix-turn-helix domain-containing protein n=1 Tax=Streptomyces xiaopingdaonensis TaxID=1565415 RepID=UPI000680AFCF|nr:helix-turn-helix transcriptional regulator [Streptomyces xiaopingdaonensis]